MGDKIFNVAGSIVVLAIVTTLVMPNRKTAEVIQATGNAFSGALRTGMAN